jgi:hypothetical protein
MGGLALVHFLTHIFRSAWTWLKASGSGKWPSAEATVTADPMLLNRFGSSAVEIVYSYRVGGELYTGLHEEPVFGAQTLSTWNGFRREEVSPCVSTRASPKSQWYVTMTRRTE